MKIILSLILILFSVASQAQKSPNILFLLADDLSYPFLSVYGDPIVKTPNLDRIASQGVVFSNAYCAAPSCTPSRAAILTGLYPHKLGEGVNLVGRLDSKIPTYVKLMREKGYSVAFDRKGWAPGDYTKSGYKENPAGTSIEFNKFLKELPNEKPFFFWFGTNDPHRAFPLGAGKLNGIDPGKIKVPGFLPDSPEVRGDMADYFNLIQRFDKEVGELLEVLKSSGRLENTIIVVTGDNGMPFPHAKANLYDHGTRVPLIIANFSNKVQHNKKNDSFVNLIDLTPTFLDLAEIGNRPAMDGISLVPILRGTKDSNRSEVFLERERHCLARLDSGMHSGYPMRAIRTKDYLYIMNLRPTRTPAGDESIANTPSLYGDVDGGPTKAFLIDNKEHLKVKYFFDLSFNKRSAEELFIIKDDPDNLNNVAALPQYSSVKRDLRERLKKWMNDTNDPRRNGSGNEIDRYEATTTAWITKWGIVFVD
ncbi:MAG: sulfatase [Chitinophagales bacterium]